MLNYFGEKSSEQENLNSDTAFLEHKVQMYVHYIDKLLDNIKTRFQGGTFDICRSMGKLFDFNWLIYPSSFEQMQDLDSFENFSAIVTTILFAPNRVSVLKQLFFEYKELYKFACDTAVEFRSEEYAANKFIQNMLKQFVNKYQSKFPVIHSFLSYVVSFPTSEAIVESWGSVIEHLNKNKPHTKEVTGLHDTGTIDKLTFIKLNGPPPCSLRNKRLFKSARHLMLNGDYTKHFVHIGGRNLKTSSLVVQRIRDINKDVLPCFMN